MMRLPMVLALVGTAATGCAVIPGPADDLETELKRFYAGRAIEEDGSCPAPEISTITKRRVLRTSGDRTVLRVRYNYFDPSVEGETTWRTVLLSDRECTGVAERNFTLVRRPTGVDVLEMSGPVRRT